MAAIGNPCRLHQPEIYTATGFIFTYSGRYEEREIRPCSGQTRQDRKYGLGAWRQWRDPGPGWGRGRSVPPTWSALTGRKLFWYGSPLLAPTILLAAPSPGEEQPACRLSSEDYWAKNRRGDLLNSGEF